MSTTYGCVLTFRCIRHGVTAYIKDMVTVLLENRPEKPLEFISEYLANALQVNRKILQTFNTY